MLPVLAGAIAALTGIVGRIGPPPPPAVPPSPEPVVQTLAPSPVENPPELPPPHRRRFHPAVERWRDLASANGRVWDPDEVLFVVDCESDGDPASIGIGGRGLMGVKGGPLNPEHSMAWAYGMWQRWRWHRWAPVCQP